MSKPTLVSLHLAEEFLRRTQHDACTRAMNGDAEDLAFEFDKLFAAFKKVTAERDEAIARLKEGVVLFQELQDLVDALVPLTQAANERALVVRVKGLIDHIAWCEARIRLFEAHTCHLPGWECPECRAFNGTVKEERSACRACGKEMLP